LLEAASVGGLFILERAAGAMSAVGLIPRGAAKHAMSAAGTSRQFGLMP
jgi:hypothetical protein